MAHQSLTDKPALITGPVREHRFPVLDADSSETVGMPEESNEPVEDGFVRVQLGAASNQAVMEATIARIQQDAETAKRAAYDEGYARGTAEGAESVRAELTPVVQQLRQSFLEIEKYRKQIYSAAETSSVQLAMAIAEGVVHNEIATRQDVVRHVVAAALKQIVDQERIRIRVNPGDLELLNTALFEFSHLVENIENVSFEADEGVAVGGCIVETNFGFVDARIDNQLSEIRQQLTRELEKTRFNR